MQEHAAEQHGCFTIQQAARLGVSSWTVFRWTNAGEIVRAHEGVYRFVAFPATWESRLMAAVLACGEDEEGGLLGVACYESASALHGLDRTAARNVVHVCIEGERLPVLTGAVAHRSRDLGSEDRTVINGIPVTSGERTVIDQVTRVDRDVAVALVDDAVCARVCGRHRLHRRARALWRGRGNVATVARITHPNAEGEFWSWLERTFSRTIASAGLPQPQYNAPLRDARGFIGYADALFAAARVGIELHGLRFHRYPWQRQRDAAKLNRYTLLRLRPLVFTWWDVVKHPQRVVEQVSAALASSTVSAD